MANKHVPAVVSSVAATIISAVIAVEGGYVKDPQDPGGETKYGITKQVAVDNGYTAPMKDMPKEVAVQIYNEKYIIAPGFESMVSVSQAVTHKLVDAGVNTGVARPSRWFQQGLNDLSRGGKDFPLIQVDGKVGPGTTKTYQQLQKVRGKVKACQLMLKVLDAYQGSYYLNLHMTKYTLGWIDNRIQNVPLTECEKDK